MSRYERNVYFEKLVTLKLRPRGDEDRTSVISIDDVVIYAEAVMLATELELETAAETDALEAAAAAAATPSAPAPAAADPAASQGSPAPGQPSAPPTRSRRIMDGWFGPSRDGRRDDHDEASAA